MCCDDFACHCTLITLVIHVKNCNHIELAELKLGFTNEHAFSEIV